MKTPESYVLDTLPLWRRNDGDGSKVASRKLAANGKARLQRLETLKVLRDWPGSTSKELSERSGADRYMLARRLPELRDAFMVERWAPPGQDYVWTITELGVKALEESA